MQGLLLDKSWKQENPYYSCRLQFSMASDWLTLELKKRIYLKKSYLKKSLTLIPIMYTYINVKFQQKKEPVAQGHKMVSNSLPLLNWRYSVRPFVPSVGVVFLHYANFFVIFWSCLRESLLRNWNWRFELIQEWVGRILLEWKLIVSVFDLPSQHASLSWIKTIDRNFILYCNYCIHSIYSLLENLDMMPIIG